MQRVTKNLAASAPAGALETIAKRVCKLWLTFELLRKEIMSLQCVRLICTALDVHKHAVRNV